MSASPAGVLTVRPATAGDVAHFAASASLPATPTVLAWVGEIDGKPVGIGGFAIIRGRHRAFVDLTEEARPYRMTLMRWGKRVMAHARRTGIRYVYAEPDEANEPGAKRWLKSLGFVPDPRSAGTLYRWQP